MSLNRPPFFCKCGPMTRTRSLCIHALFKLIDAGGMSARCAGSPGICRPKRPTPPHDFPIFTHPPHSGHVCKGAIGKVSIVWAGRRGQPRHLSHFAVQLMGVKSEQWVSISIYDCTLDYPGQWGSLSGWMGSWLSCLNWPQLEILLLSQNDITFCAEFLRKVLPHRWKFFCISFVFALTLRPIHSRVINYPIWLPRWSSLDRAALWVHFRGRSNTFPRQQEIASVAGQFYERH